MIPSSNDSPPSVMRVWRELENLRFHFHQVIGHTDAVASVPEFPFTNLYDLDNATVLVFSVPGVSLPDLAVTLAGDSLTVRCMRRPARPATEANFLRHERDSGAFVRTVRLPFAPKPEQVSARAGRGLLRITIAKPVAVQRVRVAVAANGLAAV